MKTKKVRFEVVKNEIYGDYRVDEYFDGKWNNQTDNNWSEKQAIKRKLEIESHIINLNGSLVVPSYCESAL